MHLKWPRCLLACAVGFFPMGVYALPSPGMTDRLIIQYRQDADIAPLSDVRARAAVPAVARRNRGQGLQVVRLERAFRHAEVRAMAARLKASDPAIDYVEPDLVMRPTATPNDSLYAQQWDLFESTAGLRAEQAWDLSTGSGVVVAILDTGHRPHADLAANVIGGFDFIADAFIGNDGNGRDADPTDPGDAVTAGECGGGYPAQDESSSWHGTHVAGTVAAVTFNGQGMAGVAPGAKLLSVRVLGKCGGYTSDIAEAIIWASGGTVSGVPTNTTPARVLNLSLGGSGSCGTTYQNAIASARSRGTVVVVAAGNENKDASTSTPANCPGVVTVAATGRSGARAYYSNFGSMVDVAAPGGDMSTGTANGILSTLNEGQTGPGADSYAYYQGTSMATPHVAGVAALMLARNAALTPDDIESRLKSSARPFPGSCSQCGTGLVDAHAAVLAATASTPAPITSETESNNSLTTANRIIASTTVNAVMGSRSDTDYYRVDLPAGKTLSLLLSLVNARANYDLYLYDASGRLITSSRRSAGLSESISASNSGATVLTRYVRVVYASGPTGSVDGRYALRAGW